MKMKFRSETSNIELRTSNSEWPDFAGAFIRCSAFDVRRSMFLPLAFVILLTSSSSAFAQQTSAPSRTDFSSFKIVTDRNIFNPNRSSRSSPRSERTETRRAARVESFALAGTMSYEKGDFAFFDGTSSQFRKSAGVGDSIAGYKVLEVTSRSVKLAAGTNHVELAVGMQLRREDEGEWALSAASGTFASGTRTAPPPEVTDPETAPAAPGEAASAEAAPASSGGEDEILKKLMQKREQELNNP